MDMEHFDENPLWPKFFINGRVIRLPAIRCPETRSAERSAWLDGSWLTVRSTEPIPALRVHTGGKDVGGHGGKPALPEGRWLLIGDVIFTSSRIAQGRALPGLLFTRTSSAEIRVGTTLNIGLCGPLFGLPGGGWQAEFVDGPWPRYIHGSGVWMNGWGSA